MVNKMYKEFSSINLFLEVHCKNLRHLKIGERPFSLIELLFIRDIKYIFHMAN